MVSVSEYLFIGRLRRLCEEYGSVDEYKEDGDKVVLKCTIRPAVFKGFETVNGGRTLVAKTSVGDLYLPAGEGVTEIEVGGGREHHMGVHISDSRIWDFHVKALTEQSQFTKIEYVSEPRYRKLHLK